MFFKNLQLFRLSPETCNQFVARFARKAQDHKLREPGPLEMSKHGWIAPLSDPEVLIVEQGRYALMKLGGHNKVLPMASINAEVRKRADKHLFLHGRPLGARAQRKLKEDVLTEMLPKAISKPSAMHCYIDTRDGWLVVDSASARQAEDLVSMIRETLGSFPAFHTEAEESPRGLMTDWLIDNAVPEGFELGDEIELRDPADKGPIVKCRRQDLTSDEIREHLKVGKQVSKLALIYRDRISLVLYDDLTVGKFKLLDMAIEKLTDTDCDSVDAELSARFALMTGEVASLLDKLESMFGIHRPAGK